MRPFIVEMHYHTGEVSNCAHMAAADSIRLLESCGYDAVVVTDHYTPEFFGQFGNLTWEQQIDCFLAGYYAAGQAAGDDGLLVLPGMEIRFSENNNDYLVYGIDRDFLLRHPHLYRLGIRDFSRLCANEPILIYQAHPFRRGMTIINEQYLDGIEGMNGNPRHDSRNDIARAWAKRHNLPIIGGSDFHQAGDQGCGGVAFEHELTGLPDLYQALLSGQYRLFKNPADICSCRQKPLRSLADHRLST